MSNFNYYLNRQGSSGRQGVKGEKGDTGYSPYIDIKSNTPTEFIMTIHNETESFDTPNLIPTAIGEKVTEMDAVLTTHTEDIANLKLDITAIENKNTAQDSDIAALKTRVGGTEESIEDLNHKYTILGSEVSDLSVKKQNKLVEGANITLTNNDDGTTTISSTGGGGSSPLDSYIEGSTTENVTTISAKNGKALELSAPTIAVGDNLVNEINGDNTQLYLKQGDIAAGNNITVEKTATGVKISSTGGTSTDVPIATTEIAGKVKPDGTTITITEDGTISSVGGGSSEPPANMVTTDTTQTISGFKTFTNNLHVNAPIASEGINITCSNNSIADQGLTIINEDMISKKFSISVNDAGQANISGTTLNIGDVSLNTYVSGRNINMTTGDTGNLVVNTNNPIKVHNKTANTDDIVLTQGNIKAGDNVTLSKDTTTGDITISSTGGGSTPENMVTLDTNQVITGEKGFYSPIKLVSSSTDNYYGQIVRTSGDAVKIQAQYGNPAGLNISTSSLTYTDASGIDHNLLSSGGSTPENMVTTDTDQDITGIKTFKGNASNNDPSIIFGAKRTGLDDVIGGKIKVNGSNNFEISTGAKGEGAPILRMTRGASNSPSYFEFTSNQSDIIPAIKLGKTNYQGTIKYDTSTYPFGFLFETQSALSGYPYSSFKIADDSLTFKKTDGTVVDLLNNSPIEKYGIRADYALTHGIVSNPNGIISYNATDKVITVHQGLVLSCASVDTPRTIISGDMQHTVTSTGNFTLFYANGELLECGKVDYSTEEPTNDGATVCQAWFNPDKTVNTNQQWQFKSSNTGNVWQYVDNATPLADIVADSTAITSVSYLGYRVFDGDVFAHKSEWVYKAQTLMNSVEVVQEDVTIDLSEYLPNDGYDYEVMLSASATPPAASVSKFATVRIKNASMMGTDLRVVQARTQVSNVDNTLIGNCICPVNAVSKNIIVSGSTSSNFEGKRSIIALAYRRINY